MCLLYYLSLGRISRDITILPRTMSVNTILSLALLITTTLTNPPRTGQATYYNPSIFDLVWQYRSTYMEPCDECVGFIALLDAKDMGRQVWVEHEGDLYGPYYVVDCAAPQHRRALANRGWVADLEWELAQELDMRGPIDVTIWFYNPGG